MKTNKTDDNNAWLDTRYEALKKRKATTTKEKILNLIGSVFLVAILCYCGPLVWYFVESIFGY